jgi:Zn-dependent protease/CBS domain-containing protein
VSDPGAQADRPPAPRRGWGGLQVGRVLGVPIVVQPLWFVVVVLFTAGSGQTIKDNVAGLSTNAAYAAALAFVLLLYASVLLHELSHVVVARSLGMQVRRIVLQFLGGASEIVEEDPGHPARDFMVAMAGPLCSVFLAGVGAAVAPAFEPHTLPWLFAQGFAWVNALVAAFNLLPGFPLDGGRALLSVVWRLTEDKNRAQFVSGWVGRGLAIALAVYGAYVQNIPTGHGSDHLSGIYLLLLAFFIWANASWVIGRSKLGVVVPRLDIRAMSRRALSVAADLPVAEAVRRAHAAAARALVVVDSYGRPVGVVSEAAVMATPPQRQPWVSVSELARPVADGLLLRSDISGDALLAAVQAHPATEYLVVEPSGALFGVLARADVIAALQAAGLR